MKIISTIAFFLINVLAANSALEHLIYNSIEGGDGQDRIIDMVSFNDTLYIVSHTDSKDLYVSENALGKEHKFLQDIYIRKYLVDYDELSLLEATYYGTEDEDTVTDLEVDTDGNIIISGYTASPNFETINGLQNQNIQGVYGFITKMNPDLSEVTYATRFGGLGDDKILTIYVNLDGSIYFGGETTTDNLPTNSLAEQPDYKGAKEGFYGKLNKSGSVIDELSYMGGANDDYVKDLIVEKGDLYVLAAVSSSGIRTYPRGGFGQWQSEPYDESHDGGFDIMVAKFVSGTDPEFITYFGGSKDEIPTNIWTINGAPYFGGTTSSAVSDGLDLTNNAANSDLIGGESDFFLAMLKPIESTGSGNWKRSFQEIGFATTIGSKGDDIATSLLFDQNRFAFIITGQTDSKTYPSSQGEKGYGGIDGVVSYVSTNGSEVLEEFLIGDKGNEVAVGITNIRNSFFIASNTDQGEDIEKSWNGLKAVSTGTDDEIISRFAVEQVEIGSPDKGEELCMSGSLNINFNRINDPNNIPARITIQKKDNPEKRFVFTDNQIQNDYLGIPYDEYDFSGGEYTIKVALQNGVIDYIDPGIVLTPSPAIDDTEIMGLSDDNEICEGNSLSFVVTDNGYGESYKWFKDNLVIPDQTGSTLDIASITPADEGIYKYEISGLCSPVAKSENFEIIVTDNVKNVTTIEDINILEGVQINVAAISEGEDLEYEWFKNDEKIIGKEDKELIYEEATTNLSGTYKARIYNDCSEEFTNEFIIDVQPSSINEVDAVNSLFTDGNGNVYLKIASNYELDELPTLYDIQGKVVKSSIRLDNYTYIFEKINQSGIYLVYIKTAQGVSAQKISIINE